MKKIQNMKKILKSFPFILILFVLAFKGRTEGKKYPLDYKGFRIVYYKVISQQPLKSVEFANDGYEYELVSNLRASFFEKTTQLDPEAPIHMPSIGGGKGKYYVNPSKGEKIYLSKIMDTLLMEDMSSRKTSWQIDKSQLRTIAGYHCYHATGIIYLGKGINDKDVYRHVEAWFTPELPFPFGPDIYEGLPGVILAAGRGSYHFVARKVTLMKKEPTILKPEGRILSPKEYLDIVGKIFERKTGRNIVKELKERAKKRANEKEN